MPANYLALNYIKEVWLGKYIKKTEINLPYGMLESIACI